MRSLRWLLVGFVGGFAGAFVVSLLRSRAIERDETPPVRQAGRTGGPAAG